MSVTDTSKKPSKTQEKINFYLTIVVLILLVILPPLSCGLLYLSRVPDITWGNENGLTYTRIWMHRERRPVGIGIQRQRIIETYSDTEVCAELRLSFILWGRSREAEPVTSERTMLLIDGRWQPISEECR